MTWSRIPTLIRLSRKFPVGFTSCMVLLKRAKVEWINQVLNTCIRSVLPRISSCKPRISSKEMPVYNLSPLNKARLSTQEIAEKKWWPNCSNLSIRMTNIHYSFFWQAQMYHDITFVESETFLFQNACNTGWYKKTFIPANIYRLKWTAN